MAFNQNGRSTGRPYNREEEDYESDVVDQTALKRFEQVEERDVIDLQMGFAKFTHGPARIGWMTNMRVTAMVDGEWPGGRSAIDFYFLQDDGSRFKAAIPYSPYFYIKCRSDREGEVEEFLRRKFGAVIEGARRTLKEDLDMANHVGGRKALYLQLSFRNTFDLTKVRNALQPLISKNKERDIATVRSAADLIVDMREHDVPYHLRVAIDLELRCGLWYNVAVAGQTVHLERIKGRDYRPDPIVLAFDIETSKKPLKFPDPSEDPIMMLSYMVDGRGFLITNRAIISKDIDHFEYTPLPDLHGRFHVYNEPTEAGLLNRFFAHIQQIRPLIIASYNGDNFDWPYVEKRASANSLDMSSLIGFRKTNGAGNDSTEYMATYATHMDCFYWVKRDSYLPVGSRGLKAVAKAKLGYNPLELDPEDMTPLARADPQTLANYSVSDAVATYYLYMKYVNPFIFSLCNLIPLTPDEILRKGSGTLCETLLMAEAFKVDVIFPNKNVQPKEKFWNGHLLDGETYVGGHVEALEAGVFRSDLKYRFKIVPEAVDQLMNDLERALTFHLKNEGVNDLALVTNYQQVHDDIKSRLEELKVNNNRMDQPLIYHLDVGAMYPNIILTNRLQPPAIVTEANCAVCDYNVPGKTCQRPMAWTWRGEYFTSNRGEYRMIKGQLERERFTLKRAGSQALAFHELTASEQHTLITKRLGEYSQKVYKRTKQSEQVQRTSIVCMRENSFYVDTVRSFRDHRYTYKSLCKVWKKRLDDALKAGDPAAIEAADKMHIVYDSLQLAHKCILNSFYGYVMRKGARWFSMEMGGIVCQTGSQIITLARELVEQIGRPLELDTDGIWCMLPWEFPQNYSFELQGGKKVFCAYPSIMLNHLVHDQFTNHQYQTLVDRATHEYRTDSENSIFFEIDGPYRAMILPSSTEEGKQLKKRYAVFHKDGSLAELKGFEVKRRGELKLIKIFQSQLFKTFLEGSTLEECYGQVAKITNYWLDMLDSKGVFTPDHELFELLSENRSMSKALDEYEGQKSTSISTAKRLAEFLGDAMAKDRGGLACHYVISEQPRGDPVNTRAVPVAIWSAEPDKCHYYLRSWLKDPSRTDFDLRTIIDWAYYRERFGSTIQKLIIIPAALQGVSNPVPRVDPPDWLVKKIAALASKSKQTKITDSFTFSHSQPAIAVRPAEEARCPSLDDDYAGWVSWQKDHVWKRGRSVPTRKGALDSFVTHEKADHPMHILRIKEGSRPGLFDVMGLANHQVTTISVKHQRRFYVHCHEPIPDTHFSQVHLRLPHCQTKYLYEVVVGNESEYRSMLPRISTTLFAHSNVEGVYEADLDLPLLQLACSVGCVAKTPPGKIIDADLLTSKADVEYLGSAAFGFVHKVSAGDGRTLYVLMTKAAVDVFVVDPFGKKLIGSGKAIVSQFMASNAFCDIADASVSVTFAADDPSVVKSIQKLVPKPTILMSASDVGLPDSEAYAVVSLPQPGPFMLGPLDWQRAGLRRACEEAQRCSLLADQAIRLSRYSRLPLSFVVDRVLSRTDQSVALADLFFIRTLKQSGYVLPNSSTQCTPDFQLFQVDRPGVYEKVCVELDLSAVPLNAIMDYGRLQEELGVDADMPPSFQVLKSMLTAWIREALSPHAVYAKEAESLLSAFHRWTILSAMMPAQWSDPLRCAISQTLQVLTDHITKHAGSLVVHADHNRLLLMTPRETIANAQAYIEWLIGLLQSVFSWCQFVPRKYYKSLVHATLVDRAGVLEDGKVEVKVSFGDHLPIALRGPFQQAIASYLLLNSAAKSVAENAENLLHSGLDEDDGQADPLSMDFKDKVISMVLSIGKAYQGRLFNELPEEMRFPLTIGSIASLDDLQHQGAAFIFCKYVYAMLQCDKTDRSTSLFKTLDKALLISGSQRSGFDSGFDLVCPISQDALSISSVNEYCCLQCDCVYKVELLRQSLGCQHCAAPIDLAQAEGALLLQFHRMALMAAQDVDAVCAKCGDVRAGYLRRQCTKCLSGQYVKRVAGPSVYQRQVLRDLAERLEMKVLFALLK